ncbi:MAG TPA: TIM-barrel domain-containing protein [Opitutaceae bacterium]|nr:TIM-barrel domain-containing protein [Opitutaceae bacterium]
MYFNKISHPENFVFATRANPKRRRVEVAGLSCRLEVQSLGGDVHRVTVAHERWPHHGSQAELASSVPGETRHRVELTSRGSLALLGPDGQPVLRGADTGTFGVCGTAWMFQFHHEPTMQFYGLGEHSGTLEKSGQRMKCWHTDLFGDFSADEVRRLPPNPMYASMPWVIVRQGDCHVGLLVDHPGSVFIELASNFLWARCPSPEMRRQSFYLGAREGQPDLYVIVGPSLPELTRKLQHLVGRTPLPPLWALGYHQSRWGYAGPRDLRAIDDRLRRHRIPCDGLWLDIDYMDAYQVFTFAPEHWGRARDVKRAVAALARAGRRVVPILDPGVKARRGYAVCDDGLARGMFCQHPGGRPFVGFVWSGSTYFPDFSRPEVRAWWAGLVRTFAATGVAGAWLDMNDPAVGSVELDDMLFDRGRRPHASYHNQYALGMARASHAGMLAARPDTRPFLLTRSAAFSTSRYAAMWTGDNVSSWHHLRMSIPLSLGLALSGVPFNGADVAGFFDNTTPALAVAWYKAAFLFPFFRNHSEYRTRRQEPWALGAAACTVITHYIRLRYKLLPYLYQLFIAQAETGEAILRPLFYDFADTAGCPLGRIDDEFLVGPALLQAPVVHENRTSRALVLPGPARWFSAHDGRWLTGGRTVTARAAGGATPLYVREGALVPMQAGERTDARNDLADLEVHCFLRPDTRGTHPLRYACDDGESFAYQRGVRTRFALEASVADDGTLEIAITDVTIGYRPVRFRLVTYATFTRIRIRRGEHQTELESAPHRWRFTGRTLAARITRPYRLTAS